MLRYRCSQRFGDCGVYPLRLAYGTRGKVFLAIVTIPKMKIAFALALPADSSCIQCLLLFVASGRLDPTFFYASIFATPVHFEYLFQF